MLFSFSPVRLLALGIMLSIGSLGYAAPHGTPKQALKGAAKKGEFSSQIAELKQAKSILEHADHDYHGHRAAAVAQVGKAIHALEGHHHKHHAKGASSKGAKKGTVAKNAGKKRGKRGKMVENQGASDTQLRKALTMIESVKTSLKGMHNHRASHAHVDLSKATKDLHTALKAA